MAEYKDTLNLPETAFPMKANLSSREPSRLAAWKEENLYEKIIEKNKDAPPFLLHDGPPYANGHLHCGHALNKILKDFVVKSKTMSGFSSPFLPGWDCHGLPIELNVEKKIGKAGAKVSAAEFREACRDYATSQIAIQKEEFQRLGVFGDWQRPYATYDFSYEASIIRALARIFENGHLEQGFKPVHWCISCGSALAEAEVEYEEKTSPSIDVAFYAKEPKKILALFAVMLSEKPVIVPIWTTTPWTLPANEAVALHPELSYALVETEEVFFLIASERVASTLERYGISQYQVLAEVLGKTLERQELQHPFQERDVPIVLGSHVTTESGTGNVHTAPAHGPDDYQVGLEYKLPLVNPVLSNGCYAESVPHFAHLPITKADQPILELLQTRGVLLHHTTLQHSYPHCWRHKTPMVFLATPQWFISMEKQGLRQAILAAIDKVEWVPAIGKARIRNMVETRPNWCISRQRAWGTPLPIFLHRETKEPHPLTLSLMEEVAKRVEKKGIEAWFSLEPHELLGEEASLYEKSTDTLDVWFDAGVSHYAVLSQQKALGFPADMYLEGSDQHRGWFNSSITTAVAMSGEPPYKTVVTHGYTVDAEGKKLSKSKGNYVALDALIEQHGADILRLWVASTDYHYEVSISQEIIKRIAEAYRKIRNTARFLLANLYDFDIEVHRLEPAAWVELDVWIVKRCQEYQQEIIKGYEQYEFHHVYQKIHHFCAMDLSSFYLDIIKDRQYTARKDSSARRSCQNAMYHILHALTRWLAPILSFTAEEIWEYVPPTSKESIFLEQWYQDWPSLPQQDPLFWQEVQKIREEVNKALEEERQKGSIGSSLAAEVILYLQEPWLEKLKALGEELRFVFITSQVLVKPLSEKPEYVAMKEDLHIAITVSPSLHTKCARCWHRQESVGTLANSPDICVRCENNIHGSGEKRTFA